MAPSLARFVGLATRGRSGGDWVLVSGRFMATGRICFSFLPFRGYNPEPQGQGYSSVVQRFPGKHEVLSSISKK